MVAGPQSVPRRGHLVTSHNGASQHNQRTYSLRFCEPAAPARPAPFRWRIPASPPSGSARRSPCFQFGQAYFRRRADALSKVAGKILLICQLSSAPHLLALQPAARAGALFRVQFMDVVVTGDFRSWPGCAGPCADARAAVRRPGRSRRYVVRVNRFAVQLPGEVEQQLGHIAARIGAGPRADRNIASYTAPVPVANAASRRGVARPAASPVALQTSDRTIACSDSLSSGSRLTRRKSHRLGAANCVDSYSAVQSFTR